MPHLRARTNTFSAAFRVRSEAAFALHDFFHKNGFVYVHTPLITGSDCEGAGEMFGVTTIDPEDPPRDADGKVDYGSDFFGRQTNLTVSGQLEAEGMALAFGKVYTFGPTFRAENSNTPRHAAEFWMIEPEMAFADLTDYMDNAEAMIKSVVRHLLASCPDEMAFFNQFYDKGLLERLNALAGSEFARVSYTDAVKILQENNDRFEYKVESRAPTCRPSTSASSPSRCTSGRSSSPTTPRRSRAFTCVRTTTARPWPRPICWCRAWGAVRRQPARGAAGQAGGAHGRAGHEKG